MRLCSGEGCLRAVPDDVRYCDECKPPQPQDDGLKEHSSAYDELLDKLRKGTRWQAVRAQVVRRDPICKRCDRRVSEIVDHIVPAREAIAQAQVSGRYLDRYAGYYLMSNLQGLCRSCHWDKTLEDKTHVGPWPDVVAVEANAPKRRWSFG